MSEPLPPLNKLVWYQDAPMSKWVIRHNFGEAPMVFAVHSDGQMMRDARIKHVSPDVTELLFPDERAGRATLVA